MSATGVDSNFNQKLKREISTEKKDLLTMVHGVVSELWVHPIKSCRGISVQRAKFTRAGLVLDRAWAVVDLDGTRHAKMESISQRKLPKLATVVTAIVGDVLEIDAPGKK